MAALVAGPVIYGLLQWQETRLHFLIHVVITLGILCLIMTVITLLRPLPQPRTIPIKEGVDLQPSRAAQAVGVLVIALALSFFCVFR